MHLLIKKKEKLYPNVTIQIVNALLQEVNGEPNLIVASLRKKE